MASIVETAGRGYRCIGAHELVRWRRENNIKPTMELREINVLRKKKGHLPFLILPSKMRMVFR